MTDKTNHKCKKTNKNNTLSYREQQTDEKTKNHI